MIRLDTPRLRHRLLACPACGRRHELRLLWLLFLLALAASVLVIRTPAPAQTRLRRAGIERTPVTKPLPAAALLPIAAPGSRMPADPAALGVDLTPSRLLADQAPLAIPNTAVIWNSSSAGTYLWDAPGGSILAFIENGLVVRLLDRWEGYGGVPFGQVNFVELTGWVDMRAAHRLAVPDEGFLRLGSGGYLYDEPGGRILAWLPSGTPVVFQEQTGQWHRIELAVGGDTGWVITTTGE